MIEKLKLSIRLKLLIFLLISLALAVGVFYLVHEFGGFLVWRYYLGEADKQERAENYISEFQDFVTENKLSINDKDVFSNWNGGHDIDLIIYKDSNLIYAPDWFEDFASAESGSQTDTVSDTEITDESGAQTETEADSEDIGGMLTEPEASEEYSVEEVTELSSLGDSSTEEGSFGESEMVTDKSFYENWFSGDRGFEQYLTEAALKNYRAALDEAIGENGALHPVYFVDGTLIVAVVDYTEDVLGGFVLVAASACALLVVSLIMIGYFTSITRRIRHLQKNVRAIEEGDLSYKIEEHGNDEIALLARDVGSMRDSIVDNMTRERRAWEANAGLITAMSHDIRTPLTVLLGYLDLIEMQNESEINEEYIAACRDNALRLKNLSDDMFSYFLVFGRSESKLELTEVRIRDLLNHIVSEYTILLSESGYKLEGSGTIPNGKVKIDERYFRRVMDNIFSNILKYAAQDQPVETSAESDDGMILLCCKNKIRTDKNIPESNGIGLMTCAKMMEEMGGGLSHGEADGYFTVKIRLPMEENDDRSDP